MFKVIRQGQEDLTEQRILRLAIHGSATNQGAEFDISDCLVLLGFTVLLTLKAWHITQQQFHLDIT